MAGGVTLPIVPSGSSVSVLARRLPAPVERLALLLVESGHPADQAVAMSANLCKGVPLAHPQRKQIARWRHLRATPHERGQLANALLTRRVIAEGVLLALGGENVRDGAILSAHALCEARSARKPVKLQVGGSAASVEQVRAASDRLRQELMDLDALAEAVLGTEDLSRDDKSADANPRVVHLQNRLNSLGYRVQPDGVFGTITEESVKDLQAKAGLDTSGVVDPATRDALRNSGTPSWAMSAAPGVAPVPGATPPPLTPVSADTPDVNREFDNQAQQSAPQGHQPAERDSDGRGTTVKKDGKGKGINVSVKLSEAQEGLVERLQARLEDAREQRDRAARAGDGMAVRIAEARIRVFARHLYELEEAVGHIEKDIARGLAAGGHPAKMANFARNFGLKEADAKGDFPQAQMSSVCPTCGARVKKNGVCQRGHSVKRLMEATYGQLVDDGLLQEDWATWDTHRADHPGQKVWGGGRMPSQSWDRMPRSPGAKSESSTGSYKDGEVMKAGDLQPGHTFYKKALGQFKVTGVDEHPSGDASKDMVHLRDDYNQSGSSMLRGDMDPSGKSLTVVGDQPRKPDLRAR